MTAPLPLVFDSQGLISVIVQDRITGDVRMFAHATREAVDATLETGRGTFWSRSRGEVWEKGRTSGHGLAVRRVLADCDADCLIYSAEPAGPSCHTGAPSCFFRSLEGRGLSQPSEEPQTLATRLEATLEARKSSTAEASYTRALYDGGGKVIGAKLIEEASELAHALAEESEARVVEEAADVVYHLMVGLRSRGVAVRDVLATLDRRSSQTGHEEKAAR